MEQFTVKNFLNPPSTELPVFPAGLVDNEPGQLCIANGIDLNYKNGCVLKDPGYTVIKEQVGVGNKKITGLFNFWQTNKIKKMLATCNSSDDTALLLRYYTPATDTWSTAATLAGFEDADVDMEAFIGNAFIVGYDVTDDVFMTSGVFKDTTYTTGGLATNMPKAKYIARYRDRLYVANLEIGSTRYPYRVGYSSVPESGAITWSNSTDLIDIDWNEDITGIHSIWDKLMIFTDFKTYSYDQTSKKAVYEIGCVNNQSIAAYGQYLIWATADNVYVSNSVGATPEPIGGRILQLIRNANPGKFKGRVIDDEYKLYLGTTAANGVIYSNCLATFNFRTLNWTWRSLAHDVTMLERYTDIEQALWFGTSNGYVMRKSKWSDAIIATSDAGSKIVCEMQTLATDFGDPTKEKKVYGIEVVSEVPNGATARIRFVKKNQQKLDNFISLGKITKTVQYFPLENLKKLIPQGHFAQFDLSELSDKESFVFNQITYFYDFVDTKLS